MRLFIFIRNFDNMFTSDVTLEYKFQKNKT